MSGLKEADARKRLVRGRDAPSPRAVGEPQRSRRSKASGTDLIARVAGERDAASKKQTLESVWYKSQDWDGELGSSASKKQTLESVWYEERPLALIESVIASKKQTLESVWYSTRGKA